MGNYCSSSQKKDKDNASEKSEEWVGRNINSIEGAFLNYVTKLNGMVDDDAFMLLTTMEFEEFYMRSDGRARAEIWNFLAKAASPSLPNLEVCVIKNS